MEETKILFDKYNGRITIDQIVGGISCCLENAKELFLDAQILRRSQRYPRALSLLLMSMQEAGKIEILRKMASISSGDQKKWKKLWKQFRSHEIKDALGYSHKICTEFSKSAGDIFWEQLIYDKNFSSAKEKARQFALYVDYIASDNEWWSPSAVSQKIQQLKWQNRSHHKALQ
ncbi:MAG TPA: AbiV family abortive infection protein [Nitrospirae bacterium]|nr:hypothetical protein BMS3Abin06_00104 [bacterium BMS3Abin06]HDH06314.1 AbiV family abortive infection protein [Nitrospirota bacterium]HDH10653.1 AbiV family abortive infection protein [Nitrospirota bacterium]HDZ02334.1 AbiV family abortive infection protein [Nitrospirota bacterium]